jgi:hypothetical protein
MTSRGGKKKAKVADSLIVGNPWKHFAEKIRSRELRWLLWNELINLIMSTAVSQYHS